MNGVKKRAKKRRTLEDNVERWITVSVYGLEAKRNEKEGKKCF